MAADAQRTAPLPKTPSGIRGLDEITLGGLPRGRPTLVAGGAGCGKTLLAMEFLVRGATKYNEPGVFMAFEETAEDLAANVRSLGFDLEALIERNHLAVDHVRVERSEIEETGEYDLDALFIRLGHAIDTVGAKRVVLDTLETLFGGLTNQSILRAEQRRLFQWLKDRGVTAIVTAEQGHGALTRHGLEEFVSDCVIVLDHRVVENLSTRHLRIVKYRGSTHGTNVYPFVIDESGIVVLPITSIGLDHDVSDERISTGVPGLDALLAGQGLYRGSSVLISGTSGTGKTTLASYVAEASCARAEPCLYLGYEEPASQLVRNMRSVGLDLAPRIANGLLHVHATRPTSYGLEAHLIAVHRLVDAIEPALVVIDPVSALLNAGSAADAQGMLTRTLDFLKSKRITAVLTSLALGGEHEERTQTAISSLIDTWILMRDVEVGRERDRSLYVLKSRGMAHSNRIREFLLTEHGLELQDGRAPVAMARQRPAGDPHAHEVRSTRACSDERKKSEGARK